MSAYGHGRHEHGQNFLTNHKIINSIIDLVKQTSGPIIDDRTRKRCPHSPDGPLGEGDNGS